jgi:hypothetical protein
LAAQLEQVSLLALGRLRAHVRLSTKSTYLPRQTVDEEWLAPLLTTIAAISERTGLRAKPAPNGVWTLEREGRVTATILLASGRGVKKVAALETAMRHICKEIGEGSHSAPDIVLLGGIVPDPAAAAAPLDIVSGDDQEDIISGPRTPLVINVDEPNAVGRVETWLNVA